MPRLRRYLPPLLMLLPVIFICGKLLLTPMAGDTDEQTTNWAQGWPWIFREFQTVDASATPHGGGLSPPMALSPSLLLADLAVLFAMLGFAALLLAVHRRRRGAWLRFSLREFLAMIAVFAAALGWWMSYYHAYQRERAMLQYLHFKEGEADVKRWHALVASYEDRTPEWLLRLWPGEPLRFFDRSSKLSLNIEDDYRHHPRTSEITPRKLSERLETAVRTIPSITELSIYDLLPIGTLDSAAFSNIESIWMCPERKPNGPIGGPIRWRNLRRLEFLNNTKFAPQFADDELENFSHCSRLETMQLWDCPVTDTGFAHLTKLANLRVLKLSYANITDAALDTLSQIQSLDSLELSNCKQVTDQGICNITRLKNLRSIELTHINITDAGLESLAQMPSLEEIKVNCYYAADKGIRSLLTLPNLKRVEIHTDAEISPDWDEQFRRRGISANVNFHPLD